MDRVKSVTSFREYRATISSKGGGFPAPPGSPLLTEHGHRPHKILLFEYQKNENAYQRELPIPIGAYVPSSKIKGIEEFLEKFVGLHAVKKKVFPTLLVFYFIIFVMFIMIVFTLILL